MGKIIPLHAKAPERALENLNRVTGLMFEEWPESLLDASHQEDTSSQHQAVQMSRSAGILRMAEAQ